ncbi:hypothetical protein JCM3775_003568 [Rhodotorula graminis]|uniref:HMG box domain-containing protein n=1 Tax=Rhodotorula graminis (strain WP1) TaxID=578459 RepID=A0A194S9L3_RHOGW|nr:uncharacterized protein RHOBADRAFT_41280 [Rhodotorula graminis WP1]KPV77287.1 hypothetical protein RHOBADRAFT_41280 [Rhodotorula graminis WP1]
MPRNDSTAHKKSKATPPAKKTATRKGKSSSYNAYMNTKLAELKKADPALKHSEAYEQAFAEWKKSQKGKIAK